MGSSLTKSPLERRNTVLRRSQKRTIATTNQQIERLLKDIRKFKGIEEDENYKKLTSKIEDLKKELERKSKDLVPAVKVLHTRAVEKINQAELLLENKLKENIEKDIEKKAKKEKDKGNKADDDHESETQDNDIEANNNVDEVAIDELERQREDTASPLSYKSVESGLNSPMSSMDNRKSLQRMTSEEIRITQLAKSPSETRKSIMKYGIQVLPDMNNQMALRTSMYRSSSPTGSVKSQQSLTGSITQRVQNMESDEDLLKKISNDVGDIEVDICKFYGKKDGPGYTLLKERLFDNVDKLSKVQDKNSEKYLKVKRYIESCFSFLDEQAMVIDEDDEVFLPNDKPKTTVNGYKVTSI